MNLLVTFLLCPVNVDPELLKAQSENVDGRLYTSVSPKLLNQLKKWQKFRCWVYFGFLIDSDELQPRYVK